LLIPGKFKVVPVLSQAPRHEDICGNGGIAPRVLNLDTGFSEWSASRPGRFTPCGNRAPSTHWIGKSLCLF